MVCSFNEALGLVAPLYNLAFGLIALILFIKLFKGKNKSAFIRPWKIIFIAFIIYIIEETFTVLRNFGIVNFPHIANALFEMVIISLFIYMLFLQKEYVELSK